MYRLVQYNEITQEELVLYEHKDISYIQTRERAMHTRPRRPEDHLEIQEYYGGDLGWQPVPTQLELSLERIYP